MKIEIIDVDYKAETDVLTLRECGFQVGDVVEALPGWEFSGRLLIQAIRETEFVNIGDEINIGEHEYKVVEE